MWLEFVVVSVSKEMVWPLQECTMCVSFLLDSSLPSVEKQTRMTREHLWGTVCMGRQDAGSSQRGHLRPSTGCPSQY